MDPLVKERHIVCNGFVVRQKLPEVTLPGEPRALKEEASYVKA